MQSQGLHFDDRYGMWLYWMVSYLAVKGVASAIALARVTCGGIGQANLGQMRCSPFIICQPARAPRDGASEAHLPSADVLAGAGP